MAADNIELLFRLRADSTPAISDLKKLRQVFETEVAGIKRLFSQRISLNVSSAGAKGQADAHVKEFRRIETEAKKSGRVQEQEQGRLNRAVESLQRQRSAALIRLFREEEREATKSAQAQARAHERAIGAIQNSINNLGSSVSRLGRTLSVGLTAPFAALGYAAVRSATDIDAQVNTIRAFTGSAEEAEKRLRELIATAQKTPGLTTNLAAVLDAQLRTAQVTVQTIDKVLPAIGRLNAVSRLGDPQKFAQNLTQLITQNFERIDLKELVGQSPIAGQIIRELFNVDSPTNAVAIREAAQKMGLTTTEAFFTAFADAAEKNQALANVTESIGTRLDKLRNRVAVALRPLGLAIVEAITPIVNQLVPLIEQAGNAFASLSQPVQTAIIAIGGIVAAIGPVLYILAPLISGIGTIIGFLGTAGGLVAGVTGASAVLTGLAIAIGAVVQAFILLAPVIAAATFAIVTLKEIWDENVGGIRDTVISAFTEVKTFISQVGTELLNIYRLVMPELVKTIRVAVDTIKAIWGSFWGGSGSYIVTVVRQTWEIIKPIVIDALKIIQFTIIGFLRLLRGDWAGAWDAALAVVGRAVSGFNRLMLQLSVVLIDSLKAILVSIGQWVKDLLKLGNNAAANLTLGFVLYMQGEGTAKMVAAVLAVAVALSNPAILAAYAASGAAAGKARAEAFEAELRVQASNLKPEKFADEGEFAALPVPVTPKTQAAAPSTLTGTGAGKGGGGGGGADAANQRRLKELSQNEAEFQADFRRNSEQIERDYDQRLTSLEDFTNQQQILLSDRLTKQEENLKAEEAEARRTIKNQTDLAQALRDIQQKRTAAQDEFLSRTTDLDNKLKEGQERAAQARIEALSKAEDSADTGRIARIKEEADQQRITEARAAKDIGAIRLAAYDRDIALLRAKLAKEKEGSEQYITILGEITAAEQERQNASEDVDRNIAAGREADLENARQHRDKIAAIYGSIAEVVFDTQAHAIRLAHAKTIKALLEGSGNIRLALRAAHIKRIQQEAELAAQEEEVRHQRRLDELNEEVSRLESKEILSDRELEILVKLHEAIDAENAKHAQKKKDIKADEDDQIDDVTKQRVPTSFEQLNTAVSDMDEGIKKTLAGGALDAMGMAFSRLGEAVGTAVEAFVLYGNAGVNVRKFAAEMIAALAKMAAVKAVYELAEGFAALALTWLGFPQAAISAGQHFAAAAIFGGIAGIAATVGRGVAGNQFQQQGAGAAGGGGTPEVPDTRGQQTEEPKVQDIDRRGGTAPQEVARAGETTIVTTEDVKRVGDQFIREAEKQFATESAIRRQRLEGTLEGLKDVRDAQIQGLEEQKRLRLIEAAGAERDAQARQNVADQVLAIDQEVQAARERFLEETGLAEARAETEEQLAVRAHEREKLNIYLEASRERLEGIQREVDVGTKTREDAAVEANEIEAEQLRRRRALLEREIKLTDIPSTKHEISVQLSVVGKRQAELEVQQFEDLLGAVTQSAIKTENDIQRAQEARFENRRELLQREKTETLDLSTVQKVDEQLKAIDLQRTEAQRQQAERRTLIAQDEARARNNILLANAQAILNNESSSNEQRIAAIKQLAAGRIKTEREAADEILALRLEANQREIDQALEPVTTLQDPSEAIQREAELNERLKVLQTERVRIERQGERAREEARQKDLENEQRHGQSVLEIKSNTANVIQKRIQEDVALLQRREAERVQVLKVEIATALREEAERTRINRQDINRQEQTAKTLVQGLTEQKTAELKIETAFNRRRVEEEERHRAAIERIAVVQRPEVDDTELERRAEVNRELVRIQQRQAEIETEQAEALSSEAVKIALDKEDALERVQEEGFRKRKEALESQRLGTIDVAEVQKVDTQLAILETERTEHQQQQSKKREQIVAHESARIKSVLDTERIELQHRRETLEQQIVVPPLQFTETDDLQRQQELADELAVIRRRQVDLEVQRAEDLLSQSTKIALTQQKKLEQIQNEGYEKRKAALAAQRLTTIDLPEVERLNNELKALETEHTESLRVQSGQRQQILDSELRTIRQGLEKERDELQKRQETLEKQLTITAPDIETLPQQALRQRQRLLDQLVEIGARQAELETAQAEDLLSEKTRIALSEQERLAQIQNDGFEDRRVALEKEKRAAVDPAEVTRLTRQLVQLDTERSLSQQEQAEKRSQILDNEVSTIRAAVTAEQAQLERRARVLEKQLEIPTPKIATAPTDELERRQELIKEIGVIGRRQAELEQRQVEDLLRSATRSAIEAEDEIGNIQDSVLRRQREVLEGQKFVTVDLSAVQRIDKELADIDQRRVEAQQRQSEKRQEIYRAEAEARFNFSTQAESIVALERSVNEQRLSVVQRVAEARVQAEREAANQIGSIQQAVTEKQSKLMKAQQAMVGGLVSSISELATAGSSVTRALPDLNGPIAEGLFARRDVVPDRGFRSEPMERERESQPQIIQPKVDVHIHGDATEAFDFRIKDVIVQDFRRNGPMRTMVIDQEV